MIGGWPETLLSDTVNVRKYIELLAITGFCWLPSDHTVVILFHREKAKNKQIHDLSVVRSTSREDSQRPRKATSFSQLSWARYALKSFDGSIYGNHCCSPPTKEGKRPTRYDIMTLTFPSSKTLKAHIHLLS
jgi:hypothetical protein